MGLIFPYSFTGGTAAKAQEVNANFIAVQKFVDGIETIVNGMTNLINRLDAEKADVNGSENQVFKVAPATNENQAISLAQLNERMLPFITLINGLRLSKTGATRFAMTVGGCYDSLYKHPISNQSQLGYNITDYAYTDYGFIWICARVSDPTATSIAVTHDSSITPTLIYDDTVYRLIGYVSIQNGEVSDVYNL